MKAVDVEHIRFVFGESWTLVEKWDDCREFREGIQRLNGRVHDEQTGESHPTGTKAVDIIGVRRDDLYLIEVKDFRGHAIETRRRQPQELPLVIGCKVRDTVAGLVGAGRSATAPWIEACARLLIERRRRIHVLAWVVDPALRASEPLTKRDIWQKERGDRLKQRLSWLTPHVSVTNPFERALADVVAQSLPGAGQH